MNRAQRRAQLKKLPANQAALKSTASMNRLVMTGNTDRLSAEAQLDSRLKLYIMLDDLTREHREYAVLYMTHAIKHMRISGLLQNRPHYAEWADKAEAELAESINGNRSFPWLKRLISRLDEEIGTTSAHLQLACNDHAAACGVMENIIGIINQPEAADGLLEQVAGGQAMKTAAAAAGLAENKARQMLLDYAWYLTNLAAGDLPPCRTVTDVKKHGKPLLDIRSNLKRAAGDAAASVRQFQTRFGVSLIDVGAMAQIFTARKEAA